MFPHAQTLSDDELKGLKNIILNKGNCNLSNITCTGTCSKSTCPRDIQDYCHRHEGYVNLYSKAIEIYIDLFGEESLFEVLL